MTKYPELFAALAAPFHPDNVKQTPRGYDYITARTAMNRLDDVLGPENWWDDYTPLAESVICRLTVRMPDGQLLTKADAGGYCDMSSKAGKAGDAGDEEKGGFSDAFKRAAVKFGVFRYGYKDGVVTFASSPPATAAEQIPARPPAQAPASGISRSSPPGEKVDAQRPDEGVSAGTGAKSTTTRAGSDDAQGRGGKRVYGAASAQRSKPSTPKTGEDLYYYAAENPTDLNLVNWIVNSFSPQGWPEKIVDWTPDEVRQALPSIKEHLVTVIQARARIKASA